MLGYCFNSESDLMSAPDDESAPAQSLMLLPTAPFADFLRDIELIAQMEPLQNDETGMFRFKRDVSMAALLAMSKMLRRTKLAPDTISDTLLEVGLRFDNLNANRTHPIFEKAPGISTPLQSTDVWFIRAEVSALLKTLVVTGFENEPTAANRLYGALKDAIQPITRRAPDARDRKDKLAKNPIPSKLLRNWLQKFKDGDVKDVITADHFKKQSDWCLAKWKTLQSTERERWIRERLKTIKSKIAGLPG